MTFTYKVARTLENEPVFIKAENLSEKVVAVKTADGRRFPAQAAGDSICVILSAAAGEELTLEAVEGCCAADKGVKLEPVDGEDKLNVLIDGKYFTSYVYTDKFLKPYLGPVMTSAGTSYTRLDFETKEHPHQRSIIAAVGDVNGCDFWNELKEPGRERHDALSGLECGAAFARFTASNTWIKNDGVPAAAESRTFTFYAQPEGRRCVDMELTFTAQYGDIVFGATKEAGPLGVRINEQLRVDKGGHMVNSYGAEGEGECWGKPAQWCDCFGEIDGLKCGVAVFDDERNERYPTTWHIRNYGLFAANNLYFRGGLTIPAGESLTYRWRIWFHEGEFDTRARFLAYLATAAK